MTTTFTAYQRAVYRKITIQLTAVAATVLIAAGFSAAVMGGLLSIQQAIEPLASMSGPALSAADINNLEQIGTPPGPFTAIGVLVAWAGSLGLGIRVARLLVSPVVAKLRFW